MTFSLKAIFEGTDVPVYVYKLFPEGPITMTLIREMRLMWKEMMAILQAFRVPSVNLLQFMVKENYPVRPETLDEGDIEHFEILPDILQEYLLYVRYTAILIDPFSQPDETDITLIFQLYHLSKSIKMNRMLFKFQECQVRIITERR